MNTARNDAPRWLLGIGAVALAVGTWARFKGLGTWPFGIDEYYISRSIDFILMSGLPEYPCGGFYQRGILYQYIVAGLRMIEFTPEFAARVVPAISSFAVLPAVWLLGKRLHGPLIGWLAVIILALSVWEIEMARFARMYIPFQAVFAWYLVYFLRFAVDREQRAAVPMLLLSVLGVLTWEGGVLLLASNLLPAIIQHRDGVITRRAWWYALATVPVNAVLAVVTFTNLRYMSEIPPFPEEVIDAAAGSTGLALPFSLPVLLATAALPLLLLAWALPWLWSLRQRWLAAAGLLLVLLAAAASQLLLSAALLVILMLLRLVSWDEIRAAPARPFVLSLLASAVCWTLFAIVTALQTSGPLSVAAISVAYQLAGFPDVLTEILHPWGATQPMVSALLGLGLIALTWHCLRAQYARPDVTALLVLVLLMALAVGASGPPRHETRYTFFLFPLLIVLALTALAMATRFLPGRMRHSAAATAVAALLLFAGSEDFRPSHILAIDSAESNFRERLSGWQKNHLYPRYDFRQVADWLDANVETGDVVVSGVPAIPHYYAGVDYSFLDEEDDRYFAFACRLGTVDRWSNLPLLNPTDALADVIAGGQRVVVVMFPGRAERLVEVGRQRGWPLRVEYPTRQQDIAVIVVN